MQRAWLLSLATGAAKYLGPAVPRLLAGCAERDANVRQCAVYGLGVAASLHAQAFAPHATAALHAIVGIITAPGARRALYFNV
jgi:hypothetical protein